MDQAEQLRKMVSQNSEMPQTQTKRNSACNNDNWWKGGSRQIKCICQSGNLAVKAWK